MNPLTQFKKILILPLLIALALVIGVASTSRATTCADAVTDWKRAAHRPPTGAFVQLRQQVSRRGGSKLGMVQGAVYDAATRSTVATAVLVQPPSTPPNASSAAAIATAALHVLVGLMSPRPLHPTQQPILDGDYGSTCTRSLTAQR